MKIVFLSLIAIIIICSTNCEESDIVQSRIEGYVYDLDTGELLDSANVIVFTISQGGGYWVGSSPLTMRIKETTSNAQGYYSLLMNVKNYENYYIGAAKSGYWSSTTHNSQYLKRVEFVGNQRIDLYLPKM